MKMNEWDRINSELLNSYLLSNHLFIKFIESYQQSINKLESHALTTN